MSKGDVIIILEVIVAMTATITYYKYRHNYLRFFLLYVWGVVIIETIGIYLPRVFDSTNLWLYNTFIILEFPLLILWYRTFISGYISRKFLKWIVICFLIFASVNSWFFQDLLSGFQSYNFIAGALGLIISILLYFNEMVHTEKIMIAQRGLLFWVSVGFLFFYASVIPIMIMGSLLNYSGSIYDVFLLILNIILHICFLIGLLWGQRKYN